MICHEQVVRCRATGVRVIVAAILLPCLTGAQLLRQDFPGPVLDSLRTALNAYEEIREKLATDRLEGLTESAQQLTEALHQALDGSGEQAGGAAGVVEEAVRRAQSLATVQELPAARAEFGELSRSLLILAAADPRLTEGLNVFACPMAKTFPKWIQPSEVLNNPYMGRAMPACGFSTDWSVPAPSSLEAELSSSREEGVPGAQASSDPEPEFKPGIPGLKMVDVRDHKFLWSEIEELQRWERGDRISTAEFRSKVIEKTAHFLGFGGNEADMFAAVADEAVAGVRESFVELRRSGVNPGASRTRFSSDLAASVDDVTALLHGEPRHQLFAPGCKKWLLKLAFGPTESRESKQDRAGS